MYYDFISTSAALLTNTVCVLFTSRNRRETVFRNVSCKQICRGWQHLLVEGHQHCVYHAAVGPARIYTDSTSAAFDFGPLCTNRG